MTRLLTTAGLMLVLLAVAVPAAGAGQEDTAPTVAIPLDTVFRGPAGSVHPIVTVPLAGGLDCIATLTDRNNASIHSGTDLLVGPVTFPDVEAGAFSVAVASFTSTGPVPVAVRIGADRVASMGLDLLLECQPPGHVDPPPTSTMAPPETTTTITTPPAATTTTEPPPVGGVPTGGGACADGACDEAWPWWLTVTMLGLAGGLVGLTWRYWKLAGLEARLLLEVKRLGGRHRGDE